jgi:flavorubredoxin
MAEAIVEGLAQEGVEARPMHLRTIHRSDVMTEVLDAGAILVGSPTLNNGLFPTVADFLCYMKGLKPLNKIAAAFGSYGWSGEAVKLINQDLEEIANRIATLERTFNLAAGAKPEDDSLPERFSKEPIVVSGRERVLSKEAIERMRKDYYAVRGWDEEGKPRNRD